MKHQINTIREALEFFECGSYSTSKALTAITAFAQLEAMVGEQEQSLAFYKRRCDALQQWQNKMRDPERTIVCDILANGHTLEPAGNRYTTPPAQPQYEAGDMASAHNDGFRAGVASVAQQPQEIEVVCPVCSHTFYAWPGEHKVQQPQAEAAPEMHDALCPALTGGDCTCTPPATIDKVWAQFCGGIGRGPDAPYPGMIEAFESHYGQTFTDKDWREETGVWAAAWKAAKAHGEAAPQQAEAVHNKPVRVCHIKDVACSEAAVKCGECPDAAPQQAETVPSNVVRDAERYRWLRDKGFAYADVDLGSDFDEDTFVSYRIKFNVPEPAHYKFEDDEWTATDIDAAIDAAMAQPIPSQVEALIRSLARYDWRSSSIWRHYYPSVTGTYVKVEDLVVGLKQIVHELESEKGGQHD